MIRIKQVPIPVLAALFVLGSCNRTEPENALESLTLKTSPQVNFQHRTTISVNGETSAEISAFDPESNKLFIVNVADSEISVYDISDLSNPLAGTSIDVGFFGAPNSVAVHKGMLAVAVEAIPKQEPGRIMVFDTQSQILTASYTVGALPDMVAFSPNGQYIVSANEGEPSADYDIDPYGSVSIIKVSTGEVTTLDFSAYNGQETDLESQGYRVFGPGASLAQDTEPEFVAISDNSNTAWVTLQENNGIARINLNTRQIEAIYPLGFKDYSDPFNSIDPSDDDEIKALRTVPVFGMFLPDGIVYTRINGADFIITANEGDAREYEGEPGYVEEERIEDIILDPTLFPDAASLQEVANLGRLKITTSLGDIDGDMDFDALYSFGTRSFTIWTGNGEMVYDSGNDIAEITLALTPGRFNDDDGRSDDKGAEPESVEILKRKNNQVLLFVGLERNDQVMVYDISNPYAPNFMQILSHEGDEAPEGLLAISAKDSPSGKELLIVSNEDSGTVTIYEN